MEVTFAHAKSGEEKRKLLETLINGDKEIKHCTQMLGFDLKILLLSEYRLATNHELLTKVTHVNSIQVGGRWFIQKY